MSGAGQQRLSDLLVDPAETLDVEIKPWLDIADKADFARIAKALIALANHGGGSLVFGYSRQPDGTYVPATPRPATLDTYNTDAINGIVERFAEPQFHCSTNFVQDKATGDPHPIVRVPGNHTVPIRARRHGPNGTIISEGTYYIRRPGPKSEGPQSGHEWDVLLRRCVQQQREALLDGIRALLTGVAPTTTTPDESSLLASWTEDSLRRWREVTGNLPADAPALFPNGHYRVSYLVLGDFEAVTLPELRELLDASVVRYSGWPPFWLPSREGLTPYAVDGAIECWIDPEHSLFPDAAHADFWRAAPDGKMFLIRGFQEDSGEPQNVTPGARLDVTLPIYRIAECLMHAARLAEALAGDEAEVLFQAHYGGLAGRSLASLSGHHTMFTEREAKSDDFDNSVRVTTTRIRDNLPEVLLELLSPLYALFGFFELQADLVHDVVNEMKGYHSKRGRRAARGRTTR